MKDDFRDKITEIGSFWDIESMLPEKKKENKVYGSRSDTEPVEISIAGPVNKESGEKIPEKSMQARMSETERKRSEQLKAARKALLEAEEKIKTVSAAARGDRQTAYEEWKKKKEHISAVFDAPNAAETHKPILEYIPKNNPLLNRVTIRMWPAKYTFYERFRSDAVKYFGRNSESSEHVPFFSYTPQYSQLTEKQLDFYFFWRGLVRKGQYTEADYTYILLYIYEIINLPDIIPPAEGSRLLCLVWKNYRKKYPQLDNIMPEWLCDYCLIGETDPPSELYCDFINLSKSKPFLREYYAGYDKSSPSPYASALFSCASDYNYRKSKYITPENRDMFDRHIKGAFILAFSRVESENQTIFAPVGKKSMVGGHTLRDAFSGAVSAYNVKRRIEVDYLSCSRSAELRFAVTDTIKYAENKVRSLLGIRSRFHTPNLAMPLRKSVDDYFAPLKKASKKEDAKKPVPEYEKLYEARKTEFSINYAVRLEEKSWATTNMLVSEGEDGKDTERDTAFCSDSKEKTSEAVSAEKHTYTFKNTSKKVKVSEECTAPGIHGTDPSDNTAENQNIPDTGYIKSAVAAVMRNDTEEFRKIAKSRNLLPDTLCETVNDTLYDEIGDTVLFSDGNQFRIVPDYTEEIKEWMNK